MLPGREGNTVGNNPKAYADKASVRLLTPYLEKIRADIVSSFMLLLGCKLRQQPKTVHLAIKLFDIVSLANPDISIDNPKNHP